MSFEIEIKKMAEPVSCPSKDKLTNLFFEQTASGFFNTKKHNGLIFGYKPVVFLKQEFEDVAKIITRDIFQTGARIYIARLYFPRKHLAASDWLVLTHSRRPFQAIESGSELLLQPEIHPLAMLL